MDEKEGLQPKYTRVCKRLSPLFLFPLLLLLQRPSRMLLLIMGYVASAWGRAQGTPRRGRNSSQGWESGVNTSSLTDGPLHYINTQHRDRESPGRNKGGEGLGRKKLHKQGLHLPQQTNRFFRKRDSSKPSTIMRKSISCSTACLSHLWCELFGEHMHTASCRSLSSSKSCEVSQCII